VVHLHHPEPGQQLGVGHVQTCAPCATQWEAQLRHHGRPLTCPVDNVPLRGFVDMAPLQAALPALRVGNACILVCLTISLTLLGIINSFFFVRVDFCGNGDACPTPGHGINTVTAIPQPNNNDEVWMTRWCAQCAHQEINPTWQLHNQAV
jgi:hypothetical protein